MNNEETRSLNDESMNTKPAPAFNPAPANSSKKKTVAATAVGFAAGAAVGAGASAYASVPIIDTAIEETVVDDNVKDEVTDIPESADVLLVNDEGIRYAHVDADNFNEAFAQARQQVGPGGIFEYNGRLYGTYYAEEWDNMSHEERIDYQNRVNEVAYTQRSESMNSTSIAEHHESTSEAVPANAEMISAEPADNDIRILGVEAVQNEDGQIMNVALLECDGDQALFIDVDNNGTIDVMLHDDNGDGQIQESEIHDISDAGIEVADLIQAHAAQEGDILYASYDDMPDYVNDADSIMTV